MAPETETTEATTTTAPSTTAPTGGDDNANAAPGPRTCEDLPESPDGIYQVGGAGEVEIRRDGDTLTLVEARPVDGWEATEDQSDDDDEVEVDFRSGSTELEFEAEVDDGRLEIEVCDDD